MQKHLALFFACLVFAGNLFAQQHLSFKGIPIDGTLQECTNAMVNAGFHHQGMQDGISMFSGDFAGYRDCSIAVFTLKNYNLVNQIAVMFPVKDTWPAVQKNYESLKSMLIEKYGYPTDMKEKFTGYIGDNDNFFIMEALREDKYEWYSVFPTELGNIVLAIVAGIEYHTAAVCLSYFDKANSDKARSSAIDDL